MENELQIKETEAEETEVIGITEETEDKEASEEIAEETTSDIEEDKKAEKKKNGLMTQGQLVMRLLVGGYLDYLSYDLVKDRATSTITPWLLWTFVVFFTIAGTYFFVKALILYIKGEYVGGKLDVDADDEA